MSSAVGINLLPTTTSASSSSSSSSSGAPTNPNPVPDPEEEVGERAEEEEEVEASTATAEEEEEPNQMEEEEEEEEENDDDEEEEKSAGKKKKPACLVKMPKFREVQHVVSCSRSIEGGRGGKEGSEDIKFLFQIKYLKCRVSPGRKRRSCDKNFSISKLLFRLPPSLPALPPRPSQTQKASALKTFFFHSLQIRTREEVESTVHCTPK